MSRSAKILIGLMILIILASFAAFYYYLKYKQNALPKAHVASKTIQNGKSQVAVAKTVFPAGATASEKIALSLLSPTASEGAKVVRFNAIKKAAQASSTITITNCFSSPLVLQSKVGQQLTIVNKDALPHQIRVNADHIYPVAASSSAQVKVDFGAAAYYSYFCDKRQYPAGVFLIQK